MSTFTFLIFTAFLIVAGVSAGDCRLPVLRSNLHVTFTGVDVKVPGTSVHWPNLPDTVTHRSIIYKWPKLLDPVIATQVVELLRGKKFQVDLDSVDGASTYQFWLFSHNRRFPDVDYRRSVEELLKPVLETTIAKAVKAMYPDDNLKACFSFIRRYLPGERVRHPTHFDVHSHTTLVVSLNDFGADYFGGLYVATGDRASERQYVELHTGDAALHQSDLLHGVKLYEGERWSWVVWFRPDSCDSDATQWHRWLAENGDPIHQFLLARRMQDRDEGTVEGAKEGLDWLRRSAESNFSRAQNELGETYRMMAVALGDEESDESTGTTKSQLLEDAKKWLEAAIANGDVNAENNLALWYLEQGDDSNALRLFESACDAGVPDACFNVAVAYSVGKAGVAVNQTRALEILRAIDTPDALHYAWELSQDPQDRERAIALGSPDAQYEAAMAVLQHTGGSTAELEQA